MLTDPISDYLTRVRNGLSSGLATIEVPSSKLKLEISRILTEQGYIAGYEKEAAEVGEKITVRLKYTKDHQPVITGIERVSRPGLRELLQNGAWRHVPLLLRSLGRVLDGTGLPRPVRDAIAIWTHVAGQQMHEAPGFMALLPALVHEVGPCWPEGGIAVLPQVLARAATAAGVEIRAGAPVRAIRTRDGRVTGLETDRGFEPADAVVSDAGIGTYLQLLDALPAHARRALTALPLQSPGVCAYLSAEGDARGPYMRFRLPDDGDRCRLFVTAQSIAPQAGRFAARLLGPLDHARAAADGRDGQEAYLDRLLAETWWRDGLRDVRVAARRVPATWGAAFSLHADAMNPAMTARFARQGRLAHRSSWIRGLYLAGAATHPGQWVSFCAISGVLAADAVHADLG